MSLIPLPSPPPLSSSSSGSPSSSHEWYSLCSFIKILAEHKRRGVHSSRAVARYIPGGKTRGGPEVVIHRDIYCSVLCLLVSLCFIPLSSILFFFSFFLKTWWCSTSTWRLTWTQSLPHAGLSLLSGHCVRGRRQRRRRALHPPPSPPPPPHHHHHQTAMQRYEWFLHLIIKKQ